ncbi:MAG TPA: hypothetical protein VJH90_00670 [archaeon]|nr:hypothetical protein [archaeon]
MLFVTPINACSFAAKHPTTAARLDEIKEMEKSLKVDKLIQKAMKNILTL